LAPFCSDQEFNDVVTPGADGMSRWLAPEIINPAHTRDTVSASESKEADVFAFGMVGVEVFTSKDPFEGQKSNEVVLAIARGDRPKKPEDAGKVGLTNRVWELLSRCWKQNPKKRPTMEEVVRDLEGIIGGDGGSHELPEASTEPAQQGKRFIPRGFQFQELIYGHDRSN
jgi:serine/threonine protein kinase